MVKNASNARDVVFFRPPALSIASTDVGREEQYNK